MISKTLSSSCCLLVVLLSISLGERSQPPPLLGFICQDATYDANGNSTYRTNINSVLSSLSKACRTNDLCNSTSGLNTSHAIYGLLMCRGDVKGDACQSCVATATREILRNCYDQKIAIIWHDKCLLRYSNQSIFSVLDSSIFYTLHNRDNITSKERVRFKKMLGNMLDEIAAKAANDNSGQKFAVKERYFPSFSFHKVYTLAQCTPDISKDDCGKCLRKAISLIPLCCDRKRGAIVLFPSCNIRFETYVFYDTTIADAPPPPPLATVTPPTTITSKV